MRKLIVYLMLLILASSAVSCTLFMNQRSPKGYVRYAVYLLDRDGLYAEDRSGRKSGRKCLRRPSP